MNRKMKFTYPQYVDDFAHHNHLPLAGRRRGPVVKIPRCRRTMVPTRSRPRTGGQRCPLQKAAIYKQNLINMYSIDIQTPIINI